jgi:hypothetical protein
MHLSRIPVRIIAADPSETAAFADILASGQAGNLVLATAGEAPLATLVCPSGSVPDRLEVPCVVLGEGHSSAAGFLPVPARISDVFDTLEAAAQEALNLGGPRSYAEWTLDFGRLELRTPDAKLVSLTDTEARLLAMLFDAGGAELDKETLLQRVWGYRPGLDTHTLETHIYRLRQKIETNPTSPNFLMTTEAGYRLA